jgi:CRISPR-associated protein Csm3
MKLQKIYKYAGTIELLTGLAIKGSGNELNIGGADSEVIKNPITGEPYIPGSSLKGKMRSQLEKTLDIKDSRGNDTKGSPCGCGNKKCPVCVLFGAHRNPKALSAPTRIIVRDSHLSEESKEKIQERSIESGSYLELKAENAINRNNGTAESPRFMERVPAGLTFNLEIILQIFEGDDEKFLKETILKALNLVEESYLGGSGSRGYGQVKFEGEWSEVEV